MSRTLYSHLSTQTREHRRACPYNSSHYKAWPANHQISYYSPPEERENTETTSVAAMEEATRKGRKFKGCIAGRHEKYLQIEDAADECSKLSR